MASQDITQEIKQIKTINDKIDELLNKPESKTFYYNYIMLFLN